MVVSYQEIIFINPFSPVIDVNEIIQYFLTNYGNQDQVWTLPLIFPSNAVNETN